MAEFCKEKHRLNLFILFSSHVLKKYWIISNHFWQMNLQIPNKLKLQKIVVTKYDIKYYNINVLFTLNVM